MSTERNERSNREWEDLRVKFAAHGPLFTDYENDKPGRPVETKVSMVLKCGENECSGSSVFACVY